MKDKIVLIILYPLVSFVLYMFEASIPFNTLDVADYVQMGLYEKIEFHIKSFFVPEKSLNYIVLYTIGFAISIMFILMNVWKTLLLIALYIPISFCVQYGLNETIILNYNFSYLFGAHMVSMFAFLASYFTVDVILKRSLDWIEIGYLILGYSFLFLFSISFIEMKLDSPMVIYALANAVFGIVLAFIFNLGTLFLKTK